MRSSMPPCPGSSTPAVLEARRTLEHALGQVADHREDADRAAQKATHGSAGKPKYARPAQATSATVSEAAERRPPRSCRDSPAARACARPKLRPTKNAPMSAADDQQHEPQHDHRAAHRPAARRRRRAERQRTPAPAPARRRGARAAADAARARAPARAKATQPPDAAPAPAARADAPGSRVQRQLSAEQHRDQRRVGSRARRAVAGRRNAAHSQAPTVSTAPKPSTVQPGSSSEQAHEQQQPQRSHGREDAQLKHRLFTRRPARRSCRSAARAARRTRAPRRNPQRWKSGHRHVGEVQLGVGEIPQQEIADALLPAGADQQVRVRQAGEREPRGDVRLVDLLGAQRARGAPRARAQRQA